MTWMILIAALFVAFSNGANDNFKGFATVWGSDTLSYRSALVLATFATVAGSVVSLLLAETLLQQFSGKGLVPETVANTPLFILSVAMGAATTIFAATRLGFPVSTTHALIGGMIGAGLGLANGTIHFDKLAKSFVLPLIVSPVLAALLGIVIYRLIRLRPVEKDCACVTLPVEHSMNAGAVAAYSAIHSPNIVIDKDQNCDIVNSPVRISISKNLDRLHVFSAMAICFARSVNDTPKLAALLIAAHLLAPATSIASIGIAMGFGGLLFSRRVAQTMSKGVTSLDHSQGLAANLITASLVLFASKLALPVSTTHVAIGSIAGVSVQTLNWRILRSILLSWVATLPFAGIVGWSIVKIY